MSVQRSSHMLGTAKRSQVTGAKPMRSEKQWWPGVQSLKTFIKQSFFGMEENAIFEDMLLRNLCLMLLVRGYSSTVSLFHGAWYPVTTAVAVAL